MSSAAESLVKVVDAFTAAGIIPEADWSKMRAIEFQDALKARGVLLRRQKKRTSPASEDFKANVSPPVPSRLASAADRFVVCDAVRDCARREDSQDQDRRAPAGDL